MIAWYVRVIAMVVHQHLIINWHVYKICKASKCAYNECKYGQVQDTCIWFTISMRDYTRVRLIQEVCVLSMVITSAISVVLSMVITSSISVANRQLVVNTNTDCDDRCLLVAWDSDLIRPEERLQFMVSF